MKKIEELRRYFTKGERALWFGSVFVIIAAFYFLVDCKMKLDT